MEVLSEDIRVEEIKGDHTLKVTYVRVDKLTPEEFLGNVEQLDQFIKNAQTQLQGLDAEKEKIKANLSNQIKLHENKLKGLNTAVEQAKGWKEANDKLKQVQKEKENPIVGVG